MRWFRFYNDAVNDPKVQRLPAHLFKDWVNILCIASKHNGVIPCTADVAFMYSRRTARVQRMLERLTTLGLIDITTEGLVPHNWKQRQYVSDCSTPRVKRFRNVAVTPPDTDTDTDTDTDKKERAALSPKKGKHGLPKDWTPPERAWEIAQKRGLSQSDYQNSIDSFVDYCASRDWRMSNWDSTFCNWIRREKLNGKAAGQRNPPIVDTFDAIDRTIAEMERRESEARQGDGRANVVVLPRLREGTP